MPTNPWTDPTKRLLVSRLHAQAVAANIPFSYAHDVGTDKFRTRKIALERIFPSVDPAELLPRLRHLRLGLHPIVPYFVRSAVSDRIALTQVDSETGIEVPLSQLLVATFDGTRQRYLPDSYSAFTRDQVDILREHAGKLAAAELIPRQ